MATPKNEHPWFKGLETAEITEICVYRLEKRGTAKRNNPPVPVLMAWEWDISKFAGERTMAPIVGGGIYQVHAYDASQQIRANVRVEIGGEPRVPAMPPSAALGIGAPNETSNGILTLPGLRPQKNLAFVMMQQMAWYYKDSHKTLELGVLQLLEKYAAQSTSQDLISEFRTERAEDRKRMQALTIKLDQLTATKEQLERDAMKKKGAGWERFFEKLGDKVPDTIEAMAAKAKELMDAYQKALESGTAGDGGGSAESGGEAAPASDGTVET